MPLVARSYILAMLLNWITTFNYLEELVINITSHYISEDCVVEV